LLTIKTTKAFHKAVRQPCFIF